MTMVSIGKRKSGVGSQESGVKLQKFLAIKYSPIS